MNPDHVPIETKEFLLRRMTEDCPAWAIGVPILFAFLTVALIVLFRPEKKLIAAIVGVLVVGMISIVYVPMALLLLRHFKWLVILVPVLGVALFYVGMMYLRDAKSVHWLWAIFLGMLRTTVYIILSVVFLLPGCQTLEKQEFESKVVVLFDVSGSLYTVDDFPEPGQDPKTLLSRQEKILEFMTKKAGEKDFAFGDKVLAKTPMTMYRFGPVLDEVDVLNFHPKKDKGIDPKALEKFLKPNKNDIQKPNVDGLKEEEAKQKMAEYNKRVDLVDLLKSGTNIGGSALQAHKLENNSLVQAIIIVSDGQSNMGSDDARNDFLARVNNQRRPIPVITIGVGQFRLPVSIRIEDIQAPEETTPDDRFKVRVPVTSTGIPNEKFSVTLSVQRVKDVTGRPVDEKGFELPAAEGIFKGPGDQQQGFVEFEIDVQDLKKIKAQDDKNSELEGEWNLTAKTPRHPKEGGFTEPFHVTDPIKVTIQKRALRVLLFAGGATREYQFLRTILYREMVEKRMEMCIYLQTGLEDHIDQDVDKERMLTDFPDRLGLSEKGQKHMSLSDYDVIVAFDPDWSRLTERQQKNLREWVTTHSGGIIFVAGPVFSFQLSRPGAYKLDTILSLYPVVPKDSRLHGHNLPGGALGHDASRPYALNFSPAAKNFEFLKLDEASDSPTAGWNGFFWNNEKMTAMPPPDVRPKRGMFNYYPVERLKPDSQVIATFHGPKEARIGDKTDAFKDQQPFLVAMRPGAGKSLYVGSGEFWRLRGFKDGFHDRLWIKMARFVSAGATQRKKYGSILMPRTVPVGDVRFEAQIKGKDLLPLDRNLTPTVLVRRIDKGKDEKEPIQKFDLTAKPTEGEWQGYFSGSIQIRQDGEYEFQLPIPEMGNESLRQNVFVRKLDPEKDNLRTNFPYLYQISSEVSSLKRNVSAETLKDIEKYVQVPGDLGSTSKRLFFPLESADAISRCLVQIAPKSETVKGRYEDLWDGGFQTGLYQPIFWWAVLTPIVVGLIGLVVLLLFRQWIAAPIFLAVSIFFSADVLLFCFMPNLAILILTGAIEVALLGYGIYTLIQKDYFATIIAGLTMAFVFAIMASVFYFVSPIGMMNFAESVRTEWLEVGLSFLLVAVVGLVGLEWLTRKLLRLA